MDSRVLDINSRCLGVSTETLMENAGKAVARYLKPYGRIAVFCGRGGNGGDGFAAARLLNEEGKEVHVVAVVGTRTPDTELNFKRAVEKGVPIVEVKDKRDASKAAKAALNKSDAAVDALIGVGAAGELREPIKTLVTEINASKIPIISIDVPSAGKIKATKTIALHTAKTKNTIAADIGIPKDAQKYCGPGDVWAALPNRKSDSHKGDFGRLLIIAGSRQYCGAPVLMTHAAIKSGVDLVTSAVPQYVADHQVFPADAIVHPIKGEIFTSESVDELLALNYDAAAIGPGLGMADETRDALNLFLRKSNKPRLLDADAIKLADKKRLNPQTIVTPHAGEFKMLTGEYDPKKREQLTEKYAKKLGCTILLKGPTDVISDGKTTRLNRTGNPAMTKGGTGDTLAGLAGGLLAQNKNPFQTACAAAFLNGLAGDIAYKDLNVMLTASDVAAYLPKALAECRRYW
ncbi:ADP-dependent (S)-NAD(P)H-hydrate dehydratase [uncultured archaeon]|nr:ADP-dependent (S)-NAD(P)H-hydrate dehydratase [uncultured archaeon]